MSRLAAGCVIVKNNSILLLHRIDKDWYELPGGKAEEGEELERTAVREFREELDADVEIIRKLGKTVFRSVEFELDYTWFLAKLKNGAVLKIGEPQSFDRFEYIPIKDLGNYKLSTNMQNLALEIEKGEIVL
jgi:8-oxo-dGTP pyrophosphatase MutT (NUDIX family)